MKQLLNERPLSTDLAALLLRLMFGSLFVHYGYQKLAAFDTILPMFPDLIHIGAKLSLILVIFAELGCGFLVLIGFLTRFAAIPVLITMGVAYFVAHAKEPFDQKQIVLVYLILSIVIFVLGSGKFSLDHLLFNRSKRKS